jgi:hypothetical protein
VLNVTAPAGSFRKVFYDLRPAKQIERRMIIDALQVLAEGGFRIREYQYTGMGSLYFVDFHLLHRFLGIRRLLSVEIDSRVERRVRFNAPFADVVVEIAPIGNIIPTLGPDRQHLLWLDYDSRLSSSIAQDIVLAAQIASPGTNILVTVDVEPPGGDGPKEWREYFD